jgi:hypothetical protein
LPEGEATSRPGDASNGSISAPWEGPRRFIFSDIGSMSMACSRKIIKKSCDSLNYCAAPNSLIALD